MPRRDFHQLLDQAIGALKGPFHVSSHINPGYSYFFSTKERNFS